jgi:hypothetical protein
MVAAVQLFCIMVLRNCREIPAYYWFSSYVVFVGVTNVVDGAGFLYKKYAVFPRSLFINFPVIYTGSREIVKLPHVQVRLYVEPRSGSGEKLAGDALVGCGRRRGGRDGPLV